ncbi:phospho-N-acetylmuramoyl-pentapeptide-transferase homolog isoform X2 [Cucumis melo]|uniref:Phospho-N-acetylmuramoyl-pentapeptide- transferase homolog isoform X2 n=1 Tax=Cucumis melo TaxID=3656 RepID=A0A1S3B9J1_CUCME|nr:phospho-N-acetylmuramoyl-pentapeptide-transferase homolog isoform X2 [Cucumis melo]
MLSFSQTLKPRLHHHHRRSKLFRWPPRVAKPVHTTTFINSSMMCFYADSYYDVKLRVPKVHKTRRHRTCSVTEVRAFDQDSFDFDIPSLDHFSDNEGTGAGFGLPSSDGEDSDPEIILNPVSDVDLPAVSVQHNDALTVTAHRMAMLSRGRHKYRIRHGLFTNTGLIAFLMILLLYVDWCAWRTVRLPLGPFHMTGPFLTSACLASCAGYICVPLLYQLKAYQITRQERPVRHALKRKTPTMGGLFFVPIGIAVAKHFAGFSSTEVSGASVATLAFFAIGLVDDILSLIKSQKYGLSAWIKILLQVAVGIWFSFWLRDASISSPYSMKMLIPMPAPLGLVFLGKCYMWLTSFCFVSMGNGINQTDGLDGLAGGTAALAFIGMAIAVLPISSDLSIFGASMSGACVGFLLHNRFKASVFMGDTGSFALGGALAAMAACSGMFLPLFISSLVFVLETSSVILQELNALLAEN